MLGASLGIDCLLVQQGLCNPLLVASLPLEVVYLGELEVGRIHLGGRSLTFLPFNIDLPGQTYRHKTDILGI